VVRDRRAQLCVEVRMNRTCVFRPAEIF
jgi:hypothetical protein